MEEEEGEGVSGVAEAEEPRPWVGQDSRTGHERHERHERGRGQGHEPEHDRAAPEGARRRAGSDGERLLQHRLGTSDRAERFYDEQVLDHLNDRMREFVQRQEMFFLATADASGECDSSFRAGPAGFLQVLGERTLAYPEYRGNGVHASLGNIQENPHLGIMLIDFTRARIGLHINGRASVLEDEEIRASYPDLPEDPVPGRRPQLWVHVEVEEAYIHCAKHIPQMQKAPKRTARDWGTDDYKRKGGDFFGTARDARERAGAGTGGAREHVGPVEAEPAAPASPAEVAPTAPAEPTAPAGPAGPAEPAGPAVTGAAEALSFDMSSSPSASPSASPLSSPSSPSRRSALYDRLRGFAREEPEPDPAGGRHETPLVPEQRRSPDRQWPEMPEIPEMPPPPRFPTASLNSSDETGRSDQSDQSQSGQWGQPGLTGPTAMDGASGARAARAAQSSGGFQMSGSDPEAWRQEAERALAEAQRRGAMSDTSSFQGWFG